MAKHYFILLVITAFISCNNKKSIPLSVLRATNESLIQSNSSIALASIGYYRSLQEKLHNAATAERASIWQPKAELVRTLCTYASNFISNLKTDITNAVTTKTNEGDIAVHDDNMDVTERIFVNEGKGKQLYFELIKYKEAMLMIDQELMHEFGKDFLLITKGYNGNKNEEEKFIKDFFTDVPMISTLTVLNKLDNNIKIMEKRFSEFCFHKIGQVDGEGLYTRFSAIVGQSSKVVKPGEAVEITAGIGSFSRAANPAITINNEVVKINELAVAVHKVKASQKPGLHYVPVKIEFYNPDGTKAKHQYTIEYTVKE
jgi:hypothetical protein